MSKYTTELRFYVNHFTQDTPGLSINQRIQTALPYVFDFDFPIWNEQYRQILETKIIKHFYFREIGFDTVQNFKFHLEMTLNEIMPYYNQLYETTLNKDGYMDDVNYSETYTAENTGTATGNTKQNVTGNTTRNGTSKDNGATTTKGNELQSDLPQANYQKGSYNYDYGSKLNEINNTVDSQNDITSNETQDNTEQMTNENTSNSTVNETHTLNRKGRTGSHTFSDLLMHYRDTLINIDMLVINELNDLFMMLY